MKYQWMREWLAERAELREVERRTRARLATEMARASSAKKVSQARASVQVLRLYRELVDRPMTIDQIRADYDVSRRTVYNWLKTIEDAGIILYAEPDPVAIYGRAQRWRVAA